jgi:signal transduction histidine kinase
MPESPATNGSPSSTTPARDHNASSDAARELAEVRRQVDEARTLLAQLRHDVAAAQERLRDSRVAQLVEANEQLIESVLRAHADAENAAHDSEFLEQTTRLRLESQRLSEENRQIQEAGRLKRQFISSMSHEMRTPLNAVIGFADLLKSGSIPVLSPKYTQFLGIITESGKHLLHLIENVLDLSRVEAGKLEFHPVPVSLRKLMEQEAQLHRLAASRIGIVIQTHVEAGLDDIVLDEVRLRQALSNYIANAVKFSLQGGRVMVRALVESADSFRVEVEDAGIGIQESDRARLFVEFSQLDTGSAKKYGGSGLGLAMTRLIIEAQGGSVGVDSTPGVGSVFHFVLQQRMKAGDRSGRLKAAPGGDH